MWDPYFLPYLLPPTVHHLHVGMWEDRHHRARMQGNQAGHGRVWWPTGHPARRGRQPPRGGAREGDAHEEDCGGCVGGAGVGRGAAQR
jgi:hypothetical protein